jgi:hypothetical protein
MKKQIFAVKCLILLSISAASFSAHADLASTPLILQGSDMEVEASVVVVSPTAEASEPHPHLVAQISQSQADCLKQQAGELSAALSDQKTDRLLTQMSLRKVSVQLIDEVPSTPSPASLYLNWEQGSGSLSVMIQRDPSEACNSSLIASSDSIQKYIQTEAPSLKERHGTSDLVELNTLLQSFPPASWLGSSQ